MIEISIEDNGPGIPENLFGTVFEKFFRAPGTPPGGVGLGLSIVKNIAEIHNGRVHVHNRPEGGACFTIELPFAEIPPEAGNPKSQSNV